MTNSKSKAFETKKQKQLRTCRCKECLAEKLKAKRTSIEVILVDLLLSEFPMVIQQRKFGSYVVDAYLPCPYHLAIEADGSYWHNKPGAVRHDRERDEYLLKKFNLIVVRLGEKELREIGKQYESISKVGRDNPNSSVR